MVAVVEHGDEPAIALVQRTEELVERARVLGELEAHDALAGDLARPASGQIARVRLGHLVARHVDRVHFMLA